MRIPVTVEDDNCVGRLQVQAKAPCSGTEQEHKVLRGWVIKGLQQHTTILSLSRSYRLDKNNIYIVLKILNLFFLKLYSLYLPDPNQVKVHF